MQLFSGKDKMNENYMYESDSSADKKYIYIYETYFKLNEAQG